MTDREFFTADEIAAFERDGYVIVRGLYDAQAMADIAAWTDDIQARPETAGKWVKYFDDSLTKPGMRILNRVENFCPSASVAELVGATDSKGIHGGPLIANNFLGYRHGGL